MSGIYPAFENRVPELDNFYVAGKALAHTQEVLDKLALELQVTPLTRFIDERSMAQELLEEDDPIWASIPPDQWYPASEGLITMRALTSYLVKHPEAVDNLEDVQFDLQSMEQVLAMAEEQGVRFNLLIDI